MSPQQGALGLLKRTMLMILITWWRAQMVLQCNGRLNAKFYCIIIYWKVTIQFSPYLVLYLDRSILVTVNNWGNVESGSINPKNRVANRLQMMPFVVILALNVFRTSWATSAQLARLICSRVFWAPKHFQSWLRISILCHLSSLNSRPPAAVSCTNLLNKHALLESKGLFQEK